MLRRPGFTLIELLVVIAIMGVLVSLIVTATAIARNQARVAACASNLRQIGLGWHLYLQDHDGWFPLYVNGLQWFYGGKQPCMYETLGRGYVPDQRPLNPYVSALLEDERLAEVFKCPADRGVFDVTNSGTLEETGRYTAHKYYGNSYMLNRFMLHYYNDIKQPLMFDQIEANHATLVMAGDCQWYYTVNHQQRLDAHWHSDDHRMNLLCLDGHVVFTQLQPGEAHTDTYSFATFPEEQLRD